MDNKYQVDLHNKSYRKQKRRLFRLRNVSVVLGAIILTTVVINASDNLGGVSENLLSSVVTSDVLGPCSAGMVLVRSGEGDFCIDAYEASPSEQCLHSAPGSQNATLENLNEQFCTAVSVKDAKPWRHIARHQAEKACSRAGKRLPTNKEWYLASLGTPDSRASVQRNDCHINSGSASQAKDTGSHVSCVSDSGAYDMIGNVWEWVDATVYEGELENRNLPAEGYVSSIDTDGVPVETASSSDPNFNNDYFWVEKEGVRGVIRGGYFGSGEDGGQYSINAITPTSFSGVGVGFRCAQ